MSGLTADIHGPIGRSLWNRLRRRPRYLGATAAAGAVCVLLATEPNLSGIWVSAEGGAWEIYHVGASVSANYLDGTQSFVARFVDEGRLEGNIKLFWRQDSQPGVQRMITVCGGEYHEVFGDSNFVARVQPDFNAMDISFTSEYYSDLDCSFQRSEQASMRITRRED